MKRRCPRRPARLTNPFFREETSACGWEKGKSGRKGNPLLEKKKGGCFVQRYRRKRRKGRRLWGGKGGGQRKKKIFSFRRGGDGLENLGGGSSPQDKTFILKIRHDIRGEEGGVSWWGGYGRKEEERCPLPSFRPGRGKKKPMLSPKKKKGERRSPYMGNQKGGNCQKKGKRKSAVSVPVIKESSVRRTSRGGNGAYCHLRKKKSSSGQAKKERGGRLRQSICREGGGGREGPAAPLRRSGRGRGGISSPGRGREKREVQEQAAFLPRCRKEQPKKWGDGWRWREGKVDLSQKKKERINLNSTRLICQKKIQKRRRFLRSERGKEASTSRHYEKKRW